MSSSKFSSSILVHRKCVGWLEFLLSFVLVQLRCPFVSKFTYSTFIPSIYPSNLTFIDNFPYRLKNPSPLPSLAKINLFAILYEKFSKPSNTIRVLNRIIINDNSSTWFLLDQHKHRIFFLNRAKLQFILNIGNRITIDISLLL